MRKQLIAAALALALTACVSTKPAQQQTVFHPEWPSPIQPYQFDWIVVESNGTVVVGLEYNESLEFRLMLEDLKRYVKDTNDMVCFYRKDLEELRCAAKK